MEDPWRDRAAVAEATMSVTVIECPSTRRTRMNNLDITPSVEYPVVEDAGSDW